MTAITEPTLFQRKVLSIPETWNVALLGGRGGGKTVAACQRALRHLRKYEDAARVLVLRENYKGLKQIEEVMTAMLVAAFGRAVSPNRQDHAVRIKGFGSVEFGQLDGPSDVNKYQGREVTMLIIDEAGLLREWRWVQLVKSNLRAAEGIPLSTVMTGNPGGAQHAHLHKNFISVALPWTPFEYEGEKWVTCPSTLEDNPHIDREDYKRKLTAAVSGDADLLRAWLNNDWNVNRGAFWAGSLDEKVHMLPRDLWFDITRAWLPRISMDHGTSAPCVTLFGGICPGDVRGVTKGTLVVFDEVSTHDPEDLNRGLGWPPGKVAEAIKERCAEWQMHPQGTADDATGLLGPQDTLLQMYQRDFGISFSKPTKGSRVGGWATIRGLLNNVTENNGRPGLLISSRCTYLWSTMPQIQRDPRRMEDLDTSGPDHGCDALRYMVNSEPRVFRLLSKPWDPAVTARRAEEARPKPLSPADIALRELHQGRRDPGGDDHARLEEFARTHPQYFLGR
jgi:hypothetical protein